MVEGVTNRTLSNITSILIDMVRKIDNQTVLVVVGDLGFDNIVFFF